MIYNASFISDDKKLNLSEGDLFDRVINLKLNCYDEKTYKRESFVIRSDFEMIYPNSNIPVDGTIMPSLAGGFIIRKCTQKPSIKVQCKMVSNNTGINIDIFIANFFLLTADGKHLRSFNNDGYKIESVEIAMGYWGQFKHLENSMHNPATGYKEFFTIKAEHGADKITLVSPIVVTTDKLPPDSVLHIKGYVAGIFSSPVAVSNIKTPSMANEHPVAMSGDSLQDILFNGITRRYLNYHYFTDGAGKDEDVGNFVKPVSSISDYDVKVSYDHDTGMLSAEDAKKYGVKVYATDKVKALELPKIEDAEGNKKDKTISFELGWTIGHTVARISSFLQANIDYTFNSQGEILVYLTDEVNDPESLYTDFVKKGVYDSSTLQTKALYNNQLPCVYNINVDAVATITCPFFTFFEPFQKIEFSSRYALTSTVSYFASYSPTVYKFMIINAMISFATVDDVNEVQITAVSSKEN